MNEKGNKPKRRSRKEWIVPLLLLLLMIIGATTLFVLLLRENRGENIVQVFVSTEYSADGVGLIIDPNSETGHSSKADSVLEQDVAISGRKSMTIPANKKEITADFYNPKENEGAYYLTFELRLCDNSELGYEALYTSRLVEPGQHIEQIELSHALEKGAYEAVIHIQPYRMNEEKTLTNNADIKIKLVAN